MVSNTCLASSKIKQKTQELCQNHADCHLIYTFKSYFVFYYLVPEELEENYILEDVLLVVEVIAWAVADVIEDAAGFGQVEYVIKLECAIEAE